MESIDVVLAWHAALGRRDVHELVGLLAPAVEIAGPRGTGSGTAADVVDWVERSGISLEPRRTWLRGDAVVVEQIAHWPDPEHPGAVEDRTDPVTVFTAFQVANNRITRLLRFDTLPPALAASGLDERDLTI